MKAYIQLIIAYVRENPRMYFRVILLAVVVGGLELIGISSLMPAVSLLLGETPEGTFSAVWDILPGVSPIFVAVLYLGLVFVQMIIGFFNENWFLKTIVHWGVRSSLQYINNVIGSEFDEQCKVKPGQVETTIIRNIPFSIRIRHKTARFISDVILAFSYVVIALMISRHSFVVFIILGLFAWLINQATLKIRVRHSEIARDEQFLVAQIISEHLADMRGLLVHTSAVFMNKVERSLKKAYTSLTRNAQLSIAIRYLHQPLLILTIGIGVWFWKSIFSVPNATILVVLFIFYRAAPKVSEAINMLSEVIEESPSDVKPDIVKWRKLLISHEKATRFPKDTSILLRDVDLSYKDNEHLLKDVQFEVRPGELVCIVGESGTGKSTILDLLCGFQTPRKGEVLLGSIPYHALDWVVWRNKLGLLRAEGVVVSGTWVDNVAFLHDNPQEDKVRALLKQVGLLEYIETFPQGIHSPITARGANLSAGQRQRLLLARALYRDPELLILDEPTSNLDIKTELFIHDFLFSLKGNVTIIVVSHREYVLRHADKIYEVTTDGAVRQVTPTSIHFTSSYGTNT